MVQLSVKWGKESHSVEVDPQMPGLVFKNQLYSLTGVPPERQKIMVKGGLLKDDTDLGKLNLKADQKLIMMGTAEKVSLLNTMTSVSSKHLQSSEKLRNTVLLSCSFLRLPQMLPSSLRTCQKMSRTTQALPNMAQASHIDYS